MSELLIQPQNGNAPANLSPPMARGITRIVVEGYKSIAEKSAIEIRPLTILAGSNSSGKSSIMQPLLLMKQTLESDYDPGALRLDGPNLRFSNSEQLFPMVAAGEAEQTLMFGLEVEANESISSVFGKASPDENIELLSTIYRNIGEDFEISLANGMSHQEILNSLPASAQKTIQGLTFDFANIKFTVGEGPEDNLQLSINQERCFLEFMLSGYPSKSVTVQGLSFLGIDYDRPAASFKEHIHRIIHVPGLRGNPERVYRTAAVGNTFPGQFGVYVASVIRSFQKNEKGKAKLQKLKSSLRKLGLTTSISANRIDETQVALMVGRLPCLESALADDTDMVNIADVGFGVSQALPVLVSLLVAEPGQLVYVEQPEIHLHPRAQAALAEVLCDAARRGIKVVAETHSESLLIAVQSLVAEGKMPAELVKLHWFTRRDDGVTQISSADLDKAGAFGEWPEDFGQVSIDLQDRYMTASEEHLWN